MTNISWENNMKVIETKGITYLEKFDETAEWYWGSNYTGGDLYEAEEIFNSGNLLEPNKLIFVHYLVVLPDSFQTCYFYLDLNYVIFPFDLEL